MSEVNTDWLERFNNVSACGCECVWVELKNEGIWRYHWLMRCKKLLCWVFTLLLCYGNFQLIAIIVRIKIIIVISPDLFEVLCFCVCVRVSICKVSQLELFGPGSGDAKFLKRKYMLRVALSLWTFGCKLFRGANQIRRWMRELKFWRRRFAKGGR